ncbi:MAG: hypothetical protein A3F10_06860 [Coxiella sp. RIFCSPHIGHO2_12_FULL_42_15]|nr:MAG: hypothetical protein A3F10_06860 [Coxiella sp. RIFCSPHIGHO2_12_FULL_42_15]
MKDQGWLLMARSFSPKYTKSVSKLGVSDDQQEFFLTQRRRGAKNAKGRIIFNVLEWIRIIFFLCAFVPLRLCVKRITQRWQRVVAKPNFQTLAVYLSEKL